jgi:hypothetical protein
MLVAPFVSKQLGCNNIIETWEPQQKTPRGTKLEIHAQVIGRGPWGLKGWGTIITL